MHDHPKDRCSDLREGADLTGERRGAQRRLLAWLPAVLWAGVIFTLSSIPGGRLPTIDLPQSDKVVHALFYGVLAGLTFRALGRSHGAGTPRFHFLLAILIATAYGISDEIHQLWTPQRSADWRDVVADAGGAIVGAAAMFRFSRRRLSRCDG